MQRIKLDPDAWTLIATGGTPFMAQVVTKGPGLPMFAYGVALPDPSVASGFELQLRWTITDLGSDSLYARGNAEVEVHVTA